MKKEEPSLEGVSSQNLAIYICGTIGIGICTFGLSYLLNLLGFGFWKSVIISYLISSVVIMIEIIKCIRENNQYYYEDLEEETDEFIHFVFDE